MKLRVLSLAFLLILFSSSSVIGQELRCTQLGTNCICSEPLATSEGGVFINNGFDFSDSPDSSECVGNRAGMQPFGTDGTNVHRMVPVSSWGQVPFALNQKNGPFIWLNGSKVTSGVHAFTAADRVQCYRYYKQVDDLYSSAGRGPNCQVYDPNDVNVSQRNKVFQSTWTLSSSVYSVQVQEGADGDCAPLGSFRNFSISVPVGSAEGNYALSPAVTFNDCDEKPCRFEYCIDGQLNTGVGVVHRTRVTSLESGVVGIAVTPAMNMGTPSIPDFWGGDWFHSGQTGEARHGYFIEARWQADSDQWIGPACEIEGCGGDTVAPSAPTNLSVN